MVFFSTTLVASQEGGSITVDRILIAQNDQGSEEINKQAEPNENFFKVNEASDVPWYQSLINNTLFWIGILLPFIFLIIIAYSVKRRIKERNKKDKDSKT